MCLQQLISTEHESLYSVLVFILSLVVMRDLLLDLVYLLMSVHILLGAFSNNRLYANLHFCL